nr:uncharacterized protein LOC109173786 [Ipomoea batatas]
MLEFRLYVISLFVKLSNYSMKRLTDVGIEFSFSQTVVDQFKDSICTAMAFVAIVSTNFLLIVHYMLSDDALAAYLEAGQCLEELSLNHCSCILCGVTATSNLLRLDARLIQNHLLSQEMGLDESFETTTPRVPSPKVNLGGKKASALEVTLPFPSGLPLIVVVQTSSTTNLPLV